MSVVQGRAPRREDVIVGIDRVLEEFSIPCSLSDPADLGDACSLSQSPVDRLFHCSDAGQHHDSLNLLLIQLSSRLYIWPYIQP